MQIAHRKSSACNNDGWKTAATLFMMLALEDFHDRSLGTLPPGANKTITAAVTLVTAAGGEPNDFSSVRLFC